MRFWMQGFKKEKQENKSRKTFRRFEDLARECYSQCRSFKYTNIYWVIDVRFIDSTAADADMPTTSPVNQTNHSGQLGSGEETLTQHDLSQIQCSDLNDGLFIMWHIKRWRIRKLTAKLIQIMSFWRQQPPPFFLKHIWRIRRQTKKIPLGILRQCVGNEVNNVRGPLASPFPWK